MKSEIEIPKKLVKQYPKLFIHKINKEIILVTSDAIIDTGIFYHGMVLSGERIGIRSSNWYLFRAIDYEEMPVGSKVIITQE
jgi:hypothetical protein